MTSSRSHRASVVSAIVRRCQQAWARIIGHCKYAAAWYERHEDKKLVKLSKALLIFVAGMILSSIIKPHAAVWYVRHSKSQQALGVYSLWWRTDLPRCSLFTISLAVPEKIDTLHVSVRFKQEIHQIARQRGYQRTGNNVNIDISASTPRKTTPPCEITASQTDPDPALIFTVAADHHQLLIDGHDVTLADTQNLLVALYPDDSVTDPNQDGNVPLTGEGTYKRFGEDVPIRFSYYTADIGTHGSRHFLDSDGQGHELGPGWLP
jgi:hypothetical protein